MQNSGTRGDAGSTTRRLTGLATAVFAVFFVAAGAAVAEDGSATGTILDGRSGTPVRGATVTVEGGSASATTSVDGVFQLTLPAGTHAVVVSADGYASQRILDVVVEADGLTRFSAVLMPAEEGADQEAALSEDDHGRGGRDRCLRFRAARRAQGIGRDHRQHRLGGDLEEQRFRRRRRPAPG